MTNYTTTRLQADEAEREALRWAGPFGYAVLGVLRMGEHYSDADFLALCERGRRELGQPGRVDYSPASYESERTPGAAPPASDTSHPVAGLVLDPSPGDSYYRRVSPVESTRPGSPAQPAGERDPAGRYVRRAR